MINKYFHHGRRVDGHYVRRLGFYDIIFIVNTFAS